MRNPKVLVTGGAGYIGSHILRMLIENGQQPVVVDDLSAGHREAIPDVPLIVNDFGDAAVLDRVLGAGDVDAIIHMAALCEVGASVRDPAVYFQNNVARSLVLLEAARKHGIKAIVFSSSAAVYGNPDTSPIDEDQAQQPTNPYGETKRIFERMLDAYHHAYGINYVALRYFNAAGAHPDHTIGEDHTYESHLIPRLLLAILRKSDPIPIFGDDYPTPDGTCVRDYVHVIDLAQAHLQALDLLRRDGGGLAVNLGNGAGFSVREVVEMCEKVTGSAPPTRPAARRPGDPPSLVASSSRASALLGWMPEIPGLEAIIASAWQWHRTHPRGYGSA
jgi:UDP-glucose 4-epimerase